MASSHPTGPTSLEGQDTDMVIRVRIDPEQQPASKRHKTKSRATAAAGAATAAAAGDDFTDISARSVVLSSKSSYFERCMGGNWAESQQRRVEVTLPNEQALEDFRLLIKLSYTNSYVRDAGALLALETRLRLGVLADGYEFVGALNQVVESIPVGLDLVATQTCLDNLPPQLEQSPAMVVARTEAAAQLARGIKLLVGEEGVGLGGVALDEAAVKPAVAALAKYLGPVASMFETEGAEPEPPLQLRGIVKRLPKGVFKWLLASDALQLELEDEAFTLLEQWAHQSDECYNMENLKKEYFQQLAPLLRYHHMSPGFIANVVCECKWMDASLLRRLASSLAYALYAKRGPSSSYVTPGEVGGGSSNRGVPLAQAVWKLGAVFSLGEVAALQPERFVEKRCGLVAGRAVSLRIWREKEGKLGASLVVDLPKKEQFFAGTPVSGLDLHARWMFPNTFEYNFPAIFTGQTGEWGDHDVFEKPWEKVVYAGSPYFPEGRMEIKVTVKIKG